MKTGLFKDDRDTIKRRTRHRDGRLLRGGIGLTTGLGWSDRYANALYDLLSPGCSQLRAYSEDEDSPSPLTRRLSSMALSRTSSFASLRSQYATGSSHSRMQTTTSADGTLQRQSSLRSSAFSATSSASMRLPSTREDDDMEAPPLPPKDPHTTWSLPVRRSQSSLPSTPGPRTLKNKPSLKSIPSASEFGVMDRPPITQSVSSGPRPLKLTSSASMLRSSSLGTSPGSRLVNGNSMSNPVSRPAQTSSSRNRTNSVPSSTIPTPSPLLKNSKSLPKPVPLPSSPLQDQSRPRSRIGTGMMYKKSGPTTSEFGVTSGLKKPTLSVCPIGTGGGVKGRGLGVPSPLRAGSGSSSGSSPVSSTVEFGIAL